MICILQPRPCDPLALNEFEAECYFHRGLKAGAADLAIALQRVAVAKIEDRDLMKNRQIHGRSFSAVRRIHISTKSPGPQAAKFLLSFRGRRDPSQHRAKRHGYPFHRASRKVYRARHSVTIDPPDIASV